MLLQVSLKVYKVGAENVMCGWRAGALCFLWNTNSELTPVGSGSGLKGGRRRGSLYCGTAAAERYCTRKVWIRTKPISNAAAARRNRFISFSGFLFSGRVQLICESCESQAPSSFVKLLPILVSRECCNNELLVYSSINRLCMVQSLFIM